MRPINCFLFDVLSDSEKTEINKSLNNKIVFAKGKEIYKNGMLGILLDGSATVKRLNDIGDSITIRNISAGDVFGAASMFGDWKDGMSSIVSTTKCKVLYINETEFCEIIKNYPQFSINYIKYLSDRIRFLNRKLDTFTANSTEEKLYEYLISIADINGSVSLSFGMSELARRLNVGRTSLYRDIAALESKKLIYRNGRSFKILK